MKINLLDDFEVTVSRVPDKTALIDADREVSFSELRDRAVRCALTIIEIVGDRRNSPVAVFLPKCIEVAVADIACMYSANIFMNLDVKTPSDRIGNILSLIKPSLVLTDSSHYDAAVEAAGEFMPIINIDQVASKPDCCEKDMRARLNMQIDTDPVCIINTSGSTGTPKGVVLSHRSFYDFLAWSDDAFHFDGTEVIGGLSPVVFDIYDHELFLMMTKGSTIVMLGSQLASFPAKLLKELEEKKVTYLFWVPSIMVTIANMDLLSKVDLSALKLIWFAGEVFPTKQFNYWRRMLPQARFANLYGPIEITLDCTYCVLDGELPEESPLPIGVPCRNTDVLILDEEDRLCAVREKGELCIRGTSLALGYYNNPEKTAAAFVQNPLNHAYPETIYRTGDVVYQDEEGIIHFCGRKDSLIKHHGYRIELGEIEHTLVNTLKLVKYCCAVYDFDRRMIVMYYEHSEEISMPTFRKEMSAVLPSYMIPSRFIRMDHLPRNTNGKIDRLLLKEEIGSGS